MRALRKILVVDDDPVVGRSFNRVLSDKGYAVITARNGEEALKKLAEENYDAVFTDIKMPGMDGIEVAEHVRAKRPWLPVVIVTGYGSTDNEARAEAAGVSGFLHKPLSPDMIESSALKAIHEKDHAAAPATAPEPAAKAAPARPLEHNAWKNVALFLAAPFIGLAYVIAFPIFGLAMLVWMGAKALVPARIGRFLKNVALFLAAPFVALAYTIAFPFIGLGMLAWTGVRALAKRAGSE